MAMEPILEQVRIDEEFSAIGLERLVVTPVWKGVDRPSTGGISTGKNRKLAQRLQAAMLAGAALENPRIATDVNGHTYVAVRYAVMGRHLNADLKRLGF